MYFCNPTTGTREWIEAKVLGFIDTPAQGNKRPEGVVWCMDNGAFSDNWDEAKWWRYLVKHAPYASTCLFATAPDVVGDAQGTLDRSLPWLPKIRALGYPVALVAQDGLEDMDIPWDEFDCLFIGGDPNKIPEWKLGAGARWLVQEAKRRGKHAHMGRVNSHKRFRYAEAIGCDSVDGTYLTRGPDENLPKLLRWVRSVEDVPALFDFKEPA